jgi:oligo-1,6-glucosidase/alpha-glucosidase
MQHKWVPQFLADRSGEILNRDECRTPMLWSEKPNAALCPDCAEPWLPIAESFKKINVEAQTAEPGSLYNFYKKMIRFRNETPALQAVSLEIAHDFCDKKILAYRRILNGEKHMILLNMSRHTVKSPISTEVLLSTHSRSHTHELQPFEVRVLKETFQDTVLQ